MLIQLVGGPIQLPDGTAGVPALFFGTSPGSGLFLPSANTIGISTAGLEVARVTSDQRLTIGASGNGFVNIQSVAAPASTFRCIIASGSSGTTPLRLTADAAQVSSLFTLRQSDGTTRTDFGSLVQAGQHHLMMRAIAGQTGRLIRLLQDAGATEIGGFDVAARVYSGTTGPLARITSVGTADEIQCLIRNNGTQTTNPIVLQNSAGTVQLLSIGPDATISIRDSGGTIRVILGQTGRNVINNNAAAADVALTILPVADNDKVLALRARVAQAGALLITQNSSLVTQLAIAANGRDFTLDTVTGTKWGTASNEKQGWWNAVPVVRDNGWSATNVVTTRTFDANTVDLATLADVVGTLVETVFKTYGLIGA